MNKKKFVASMVCLCVPGMLFAQSCGIFSKAANNNAKVSVTTALKSLVSGLTTLSTTSQSLNNSQVYLYNVDGGEFLGTEYSSNDYQFDSKYNAIGFGATGKVWTIKNYIHNDVYNLYSGSKRLGIGYGMHNSEWIYTYLGTSTSHSFRIEPINGTSYYTISIVAADALYGEYKDVNTTGKLSLASSRATNGKTYFGWSGEAGFKVMLPLISANDAEPRGTRWILMPKSQYISYQARIAAAHDARMAAWPIIRSVRRSTMNINISNLIKVYEDYKSTAAQINAAAAEAKNIILSSLSNATSSNYVDLSFLLADADCQSKDITSWNVEGNVAYDEKTVRTNVKMFGGRFYETKNATLSQVLENLPEGRYTFSADVKATANGAEIFAGNDLAEATAVVPANSGIFEFTTSQFTVNNNSSKVNVGIRVNGSDVVAFDNFKLRYVGVNEQKNSFSASTTGSSKPVDNVYKNGYVVEDGTLYITGTWNEDDKQFLDYIVKSNPEVKTIDLQETDELPENATIDVTGAENKNLLVYVPEDANVTVVENGEEKTTNVVYGDYCQNLVVEDKVEMSITKPFTAEAASYSRAMNGNQLGTICLPFEMYSVEGKVQLYRIKSYNNGNIETEAVSYVPANEPCVFKNESGDTLNVISSSSNIEMTDGILNSAKTSDGIFLTGSYTNNVLVGQIDDTHSARECFYIKSNKFKRGYDYFYVSAYRAYVDAREYVVSASNARNRIASGYGITEEALANSIEKADAKAASLSESYNVDGTRTNGLTSRTNIVKYSDGSVKKIFK